MRRIINIGTAPNDGTGDPIRTAMEKMNDNFQELYTQFDPLTWDDLTQEQKDSLKGAAFTYQDFTQEQLEGLKGASGLTAYQVAVNNGFVGTEAEWIASLHASYELEKTSVTVNPAVVLQKDKSVYQLSIVDNTTITFDTSQLTTGKVWRFMLKISEPALKTITWPANIYWYGGADFSRIGDYYYDFYSEDNGVHWIAYRMFENTQYVNPVTNKIVYVDGAKADDSLSGLSWANAKKNVQAAIDLAVAGDVVFVKEGTYLPTTERTPGTARSKSFIMKSGVHVYGGFQGTETSPAERVMTRTTEILALPYGDYTLNIDTPTYETILSGDLDGDSVDGGQAVDYKGNRLTNITNNAYRVVQFVVSSATILSGVKIQGGNANGGGTTTGAGIGASGANSITINSVIKNNYSSGDQANCLSGTYNSCIISNGTSGAHSGCGSITAINCKISYHVSTYYGTCYNSSVTCCLINNNAAGAGGGTYNATAVSCKIINNTSDRYQYSGGGCLGGTITNCSISNNSAQYGGGATNATTINCRIRNNTASVYGGGAYNSTCTNCEITNNSAVNGGGVYSGTITNSTISRNIASTNYGGAYDATLKNCVVWGNRTGETKHNFTPNGKTADYCAFEDEVIAGTNNISLNATNDAAGGPYFVNPSANAGITEAATDYDITTDSALKNTGNSAYLTTGEGATYDIKHRTRKVGTIDIGAFEFQS